MVTREQVFERIRDAMVEMFELEPEQIREDAKVFEDLDLDSIDAIDLVAKLQTFTGKRVEPESMRGVRTVGHIVDLVESQLGDSAGPDAAAVTDT